MIFCKKYEFIFGNRDTEDIFLIYMYFSHFLNERSSGVDPALFSEGGYGVWRLKRI